MTSTLPKELLQKNFQIIESTYIQELQCTFLELVHIPTQAKIFHIINNDPENLFCLSFPTYPKNSNGAPHILEHTVLAGSEKFPVKDPFFSMIRRSLNTFMNALTGSDFTCYPASSQVEKDFYNLLEVYIDAVFHPSLKKVSFLQEGWRCEFSDQDKNKDLLFKGVVYNEMKGAMNSAESRLFQALTEKLLPDLPYAYNSGGDPKVIPTLSYEELKEFHQTYYHPSRCYFFFYGNIPTEKHLEFLEKQIFSNVQKLPPIKPLPLQKRFSKPVSHKAFYPVAENENLSKKTFLAFSWLTCPLSNQKDLLAIAVLDSILMDTDASPLHRALLESGLCSNAKASLDTEMSEVPYTITCEGCEEKDQEKLFSIISQVLKQIIEEKIPLELIESSLHQIEFSRSEITEQGPFGLTLFMRTILAKQHGCDPKNSLKIHSLFEDFRKEIQDPNYLTDILAKYLVNNPHRVDLVLSPSKTLEKEEAEQEKLALQVKKASLSENEKQQILQEAKDLETYQKSIETQSLDCLPKLSIQEIPRTLRDYPLKEEKFQNFSLFHHDCFTNNILYVDLIMDLPKVDVEDFFYLALLTSYLTDVGMGEKSYIHTLNTIHANLGGIEAFIDFFPDCRNPKNLQPAFGIRAKALYRKSQSLFLFLKDLIQGVNFSDKERLSQLLFQTMTLLEHQLSNLAMKYAIQASQSSLDISSYLSHLFSGLPFYQRLKKSMQQGPAFLDQVIAKLMDLKERIFVLGQNPHLVVCCSSSHYEDLKKEQFFGLFDLPTKASSPWTSPSLPQKASSQGFIIASPVAFTASSYLTPLHYTDKDSAALLVATKLAEHIILHPEIREQSGAYGSKSLFSPTTGVFSLTSYRDPNLASTLKSFEKALDFVANKNFSEEQLEEAKLCILQKIDLPIPPGLRAIVSYGWMREKKTKELRESFRNRILDVKKEEIQHAMKKQLFEQKEKAITVTFAGEHLLESENAKLPGNKKLKISSV